MPPSLFPSCSVIQLFSWFLTVSEQTSGAADAAPDWLEILQLLVVDHFLGHNGFRGGERIEVAVGLEAGACGDELADDDVFLQTDQMVDLALDGRVGQDLLDYKI